MLTKDLLRVSRRGGGYQPLFAGEEHRPLAGRVIGTYQGHVGQSREELTDALTDLEREADDFKLVRGLAKLLERETVFETRAGVDPRRARAAAFEAAEQVGVVSERERETALARAADRLGTDADAVAAALFADREERQVLAAFDARWSPDDLLAQYNLSLAQTALFDATEVRVRSDDPRTVVNAIKRLGLMYEIHRTDAGRVVVLTGPDAIFHASRRYGTRFARLLRSVARTHDWHLEATVDDRGTERTMTLSDDDPVAVPDADPVAEVSFDSDVEREFAARFESLDLDWDLVREPEPLATGARLMIPDFAFDYRYADFRVFFEVMGFWTPEYVEKKLAQLADVEDVAMVVAVDESLGAGDAVAARDHHVVTYSGSVRVKDVRDVLREYEADLVAASVADLPDEVVPDADVVTLAAVADELGVSESAVEDRTFPEHERVGRTLVRPVVLDDLSAALEVGMTLDAAESVLDEYGIGDASATLAALGYRVEWAGLGGGILRRKQS